MLNSSEGETRMAKSRMLTPRRFALWIGGLALGSLAATLWAATSGPASIGLWSALRAWWTHDSASGPLPVGATLLMEIRLPRVVLGWLVGAGLALAGASFQAMLRNPLATPYTLGIAGGGSLGAALAVSFPLLAVRLGPLSGVQLWSLVGSGAVAGAIYLLARRGRGLAPTTLLLAGVVIGTVCASGITLVRYIAEPHLLVAVDRWMMGGLATTGWRSVWALLPFAAAGGGLLLACGPALAHFALGEELAAARGVPVVPVQRRCFVGGTLLMAGIVAVAGPIGFVGLIVPHTLRAVAGSDERLLLPGSVLVGGGFLVLCDALARTLFAPTEIPVGVLTSLLGGPFFLYLLLRTRYEWG